MENLTAILLAVAGTALSLGIAFVLSRGRGTPYLQLKLEEFPPIDDALLMLAGLTESTVYEGNKASIFQNGAALKAMLEDISAATASVHLETFVWCAGEVETSFTRALAERARAGVRVRLLRDAVGGARGSEQSSRVLCESGVEVAEYCAPRWWNIGRFNSRTHRKLLIIDGRIAYTFGHGVSDQWLGNGEDSGHWRDTALRLEGPVAHGLQTVFAQNWVEETSTLPISGQAFARIEAVGPTPAHVVSSAAGDAVSSVAMLYTVAIACARQEVLIQNPYFAPNPGVVELFAMLVRRGVQVHLMVPGQHTDSPFVRRAGCHLYRRLLAAGVRIYEHERTLIHQKIVVIDGAWAHVGSTNFDARSLALNEEIGVGLLDADIATQLKTAFEHDLQSCREWTLESWERRPARARLFDGFAYLLHDQL